MPKPYTAKFWSASTAVIDAQVVEFPDVDGPLEFGYDEEWLGVLQATHHLMSLNRQQAPLPGKSAQHCGHAHG